MRNGLSFLFCISLFVLCSIIEVDGQIQCPTAPSNDRRKDKTSLTIAAYNAEWLFLNKSTCPGILFFLLFPSHIPPRVYLFLSLFSCTPFPFSSSLLYIGSGCTWKTVSDAQIHMQYVATQLILLDAGIHKATKEIEERKGRKD
jgi:hypothetical protein